MKKLTVKMKGYEHFEIKFDDHLVKGDKVYYLKDDTIVATLQEAEIEDIEDNEIDEDEIDKIEGGVILNEV